ncbi:hypothetical protein BDC45DRAFT_542290 [Circinella umbellata]|nr:hypothetical protein BDC45DRAFT_542290 [Circinella umbellata]
MYISEFEGKPISDNHAIVEVTSVLVPGAKSQLCNGTPLSSYGTPPFKILARLNAMRLHKVNSREESDGSSILLIDDPKNQIEIADQTITGEEEECNNDLVDKDYINNNLGYMEVQSIKQHASFMEDQDLKAYGISLLMPRYEKIKKQLSFKNDKIPTTHIVQDVWHALKRISTPKRHSLQVEFERELTDAVMLWIKVTWLRLSKYWKVKARKLVTVGVPKRTGKAYKSHYDIWLKDKTQLLYLKIDDALPNHLRDWRNSSTCTVTTEVFDISMVTGDQIEDLGFNKYSKSGKGDRNTDLVSCRQEEPINMREKRPAVSHQDNINNNNDPPSKRQKQKRASPRCRKCGKTGCPVLAVSDFSTFRSRKLAEIYNIIELALINAYLIYQYLIFLVTPGISTGYQYDITIVTLHILAVNPLHQRQHINTLRNNLNPPKFPVTKAINEKRDEKYISRRNRLKTIKCMQNKRIILTQYYINHQHSQRIDINLLDGACTGYLPILLRIVGVATKS